MVKKIAEGVRATLLTAFGLLGIYGLFVGPGSVNGLLHTLTTVTMVFEGAMLVISVLSLLTLGVVYAVERNAGA